MSNLNGRLRIGLIEKGTLNKEAEKVRVSHVDIWEKSIQGRKIANEAGTT